MQDFHKELELAKKIVKEIGEILLAKEKEAIEVSFKNDVSYLTQADAECENLIRLRLSSVFPQHGFIGEESVAENKEISWIVDPIDGTAGFAHKLPAYGTVIALKCKDEMVFCAQSIPSLSIVCSAYKGEGAYANDRKLHVSDVDELQAALITFGHENIKDTRFRDYTMNLLEKIRYQAGHSSIIENYYLASGKVDISTRCDQKLWDVAPAYLFMKEAGAVITDLYGNELVLNLDPLSRQSYIATNPYLAQKYKDILYMR